MTKPLTRISSRIKAAHAAKAAAVASYDAKAAAIDALNKKGTVMTETASTPPTTTQYIEKAARILADYAADNFARAKETEWETMGETSREYFRNAIRAILTRTTIDKDAMSKDRNYYRCMHSHALTEEIKYAPATTDWRELAIALAERLEGTLRQMQEGATASELRDM